MNRRSIEDWIFYWTVLGFKSLLSILPYSWAVPIGAGIIYGLSFLYPRRFSVAYTNIKTAFPHFSPGRTKHLVRKSVFNLGLSLMEVLLIDKLNKKRLLQLVNIKGEEHLEKEKGRGAIFLTAHYDNWELIALFGAVYGYPSYVIARRQKYPRLNSLLNRHRKKFGNIVIEKGFNIKQAIQALKRNERIGILADQNAGKNGLQVKLFGKMASTNPGFIHLARRASAVVFPIFIRRVSLLRHELIIHPPLDISRPEKEVLTDYHQILESYINKNPEQWLWFHKRWKHSIDKRILVLSDSKPGHFRQSRTVAKKLKLALREKFKLTWPEDEPQIVIKEVVVPQQNPAARFFSYLCGLFSSPRCQGCLRCLGLFLPLHVYQRLVFDRYDYIISTGSSLQAVNAIINYENKSRNICILRPGFGYRYKFDKIFVPEHDKLTGRNIVCFRGAIVDKEEIILKGRDFLSRLNFKTDSQTIKISLLIGGDTRTTRFKSSVLKEFLNQLEQIASDLNVQLFITTSRRTPMEVENYLEQFKNEHVKLLIIANKENPPGGVEAILMLGDIIFVTSDSISMITEAIAMDRGVGIIMTNEPDGKLKRFLQSISGGSNVRIIPQGEIKELGRIVEELKKVSVNIREQEDPLIQGIEAIL